MKTKLIIKKFGSVDDLDIESARAGSMFRHGDFELKVESVIRHKRRLPIGLGRYEILSQRLICDVVGVYR